MNVVRLLLYIITVPFTIWTLESINLNGIFKKNRYYQARFVYLLLALGLSYLVVNFFMDFFMASAMVY